MKNKFTSLLFFVSIFNMLFANPCFFCVFAFFVPMRKHEKVKKIDISKDRRPRIDSKDRRPRIKK